MGGVLVFTPKPGLPGERLPVSPLDALRLRQLPALAVMGLVEPGVLPVDVECIEACSRVNGLCFRIGEGRCIRSYTPLVPGAPPSWMPALGVVEPGGGSRPVFESSRLEPLDATRFTGVYRPRILYPEPLAARIVRVEDGEVAAGFGCVEWPGGGFAFISEDEPVALSVKPGVVVVEGEARVYRVSRCGRGVLARLLNQRLLGLRGALTVLTPAAVLELRVGAEDAELILWNPYTHPVDVEVYSDKPILEATLYEPSGVEKLEPYRRSLLRFGLRGEWVARLALRLARTRSLIAPR